MLRRMTVSDSVQRSHPQNFPSYEAVRKDHWSYIALSPEECPQQVGQFRKPSGLASRPQRLLISLSPDLVAAVPSYSLPLTLVSVTRTELVGTA